MCNNNPCNCKIDWTKPIRLIQEHGTKHYIATVIGTDLSGVRVIHWITDAGDCYAFVYESGLLLESAYRGGGNRKPFIENILEEPYDTLIVYNDRGTYCIDRGSKGKGVEQQLFQRSEADCIVKGSCSNPYLVTVKPYKD